MSKLKRKALEKLLTNIRSAHTGLDKFQKFLDRVRSETQRLDERVRQSGYKYSGDDELLAEALEEFTELADRLDYHPVFGTKEDPEKEEPQEEEPLSVGGQGGQDQKTGNDGTPPSALQLKGLNIRDNVSAGVPFELGIVLEGDSIPPCSVDFLVDGGDGYFGEPESQSCSVGVQKTNVKWSRVVCEFTPSEGTNSVRAVVSDVKSEPQQFQFIFGAK